MTAVAAVVRKRYGGECWSASREVRYLAKCDVVIPTARATWLITSSRSSCDRTLRVRIRTQNERIRRSDRVFFASRTSCRTFAAEAARYRDGRSQPTRRRIGRWLVTASVVIVLIAVGWPGSWPAGASVHPVDGLADLLAVAEVAALLGWRQSPIGCFLFAESAAVAYGVLGYPATPAGYAGLMATAVAAWGARGRCVGEAVLAGSVGGILAIGIAGPRPTNLAAIITNALLVVVAWLIGRVVRSQQEKVEARSQVDDERVRRRVSEDRLAMAEELHDRVGHSLVGVLRQLEAAQALRAVPQSDSDALIARATERVQSSLREVSDLVVQGQVAPRPPASEGSSAAVERPASVGEALGHWIGVLASTGVSVHLSVRGDSAALPAPVQEATAGLIAEALANAAAHSTAAEVEIALLVTALGASVTVRDPGPARGSSNGAGCGLQWQQRQLERLGGHLQAGYDSQGGFSVQADIPTATTRARP